MEKKIDNRALDAELIDLIRNGHRRKRHIAETQGPQKELPKKSKDAGKKLAFDVAESTVNSGKNAD